MPYYIGDLKKGPQFRELPISPRGYINATAMIEVGSQNHDKEGLLGLNSIVVVYMGVSENEGALFGGPYT